MGLLTRFRAFLHPTELPVRLAGGILERLTKLEDDAVRHEITLKESADQISRHLKRVAAIEQRAEGREEGGNGRIPELTRRIIDYKLGKGSV